MLKFSITAGGCEERTDVQPAGRSHSRELRLPSKTTFLKGGTAGYSWSLPILDRELQFIAEENRPVLFICVGH